ncbi:hypothetical protein [Quadrisphaera sp. KR29]|uniref:hypothetical protein n=1 Tax=Quadrisphaera sp. KR29 TaxID=3461391 RepID=UPI0040439FC0
MRARAAAVAASSRWTDADGVRAPGGEAHAWEPGTNQTVCGLALSRSQLERFPHVSWEDLLSARTGEHVKRVCPRCRAATRRREPREARRWSPPGPDARQGS